MIFSSAISGKDAKTGVLSPNPDEQAEAMFRNLSLFMESADSPYEAGFNGHVTDYDFGGGDFLACSNGREVYYASGNVGQWR